MSVSPKRIALPPRPPVNVSEVLVDLIGHAAILSDTPEKWAATLNVLSRHGIDSKGFEGWGDGRAAAIAAAGVRARTEP